MKRFAASILTAIIMSASTVANGYATVDSRPASIDESSIVLSSSSPALGDTVNIRFRATDDTQIRGVSVFLRTPAPDEAFIQAYRAQQISGSSTDAVYSVDVTLPGAPYPPGTWTVQLAPTDIFNKGSERTNISLEVTGEKSTVEEVENRKLNAGSFKGYVAMYVKGYAGKKFSAKVGNDWVIIDQIESDFERYVEFTGAGYTIDVRMYIDRVLTETIKVTTK